MRSTGVQYRGPSTSSSSSAAPGGRKGVGAGGSSAVGGPLGTSSSTDSTASCSSSAAASASASAASGAAAYAGASVLPPTNPRDRFAERRQRRRQLRRKRSRGSSYGGSGSLSALFDSQGGVMSVMLAGFVLFLLVVCVLYRTISEEGPDPTDELPVEVGGLRNAYAPGVGDRGGGGGTSGGGGGGGKSPGRGLFQRMRDGTASILDGLPFAMAPLPKPCPESMDSIGDKTRRYLELRKEIDEVLPVDPDRTQAAVEALRKRDYETMKPEDMTYDVTNCPLYPPEGYPHAWPTMDLIDNWKPDDPTPRPKIYQGLCVFDYETELEKARVYQAAEVPFLVRDDPSVLRAAERWNHPGYMSRLMGDVPHRTEYSPNNHFMYWNNPNPKNRRDRPGRKWPKPPEGWTPPTKLIRMPYTEWLGHANATDDDLGPDRPHWYYRLIGCGLTGRCDRDSSEYIYDELPFFQPRGDDDEGGQRSLYLVEPLKQKGVHCRFGMKGVIAENHFDGSRNSIALMGGERRYILSHPDQCTNLALYPKLHPSARHSAVDWSNPDLATYPEFRDAQSNEVVLQAGDVLYLPTNWFHFIVSLELNFQCNARSGISDHYMDPIHDCGF